MFLYHLLQIDYSNLTERLQKHWIWYSEGIAETIGKQGQTINSVVSYFISAMNFVFGNIASGYNQFLIT